MDGRTDVRMDGISPYSTGLCPLSGPLPKKNKRTKEKGRTEMKRRTERKEMGTEKKERRIRKKERTAQLSKCIKRSEVPLPTPLML